VFKIIISKLKTPIKIDWGLNIEIKNVQPQSIQQINILTNKWSFKNLVEKI